MSSEPKFINLEEISLNVAAFDCSIAVSIMTSSSFIYLLSFNLSNSGWKSFTIGSGLTLFNGTMYVFKLFVISLFQYSSYIFLYLINFLSNLILHKLNLQSEEQILTYH